MEKLLTGRWVATTERAGLSYDRPVYVVTECRHGRGFAHCLQGACGCGMLRDVRIARTLTQQEAADQVGVIMMTWSKWERGVAMPRVGLVIRALEAWLCGTQPTAGVK